MRCYETAKKAGLIDTEIKRLLDISKKAAEAGGETLTKHYGNIKTIESKGRVGDLVTNADIETEKVILEYIREETPNISILAEESGSDDLNKALKWCIDPLDGTTNFAHGYPFFATSIGLTWNDQPILGSISVPYLKETFWGAPGIGAFCNNEPISTSTCKKLSESLLVTGFAYDRQTRLDNNYAEFCWFTHRTRGVRRGGAAAIDLAFVASGRLDGYWERGLSPWDLAAGVALVEIAGGKVCSYDGNNFDINSGKVLACSEGIRNQMIDELGKVEPLHGATFGAPEIKKIEP